MKNYIHRGHTRRCCSQLARHKKSKLSCLQGIPMAASLTASKHMTQGPVPSSSSSATSCKVLLRISCRTVASSAMKQPELVVYPGHCLSIVLLQEEKRRRDGDIKSCGDLPAGGSRFLIPAAAAKLGSAPSSLVARNNTNASSLPLARESS